MSNLEERFEFIRHLIQNEQEFHKLFSGFKKYNSITLFHNRAFAEDPVFNHFVVDESILNNENESEELLIKTVAELKKISFEIGFRTTVFVESIWRKTAPFEKIAIGEGYRITEKMEILSKELGPDNALTTNASVQVTETEEVELWNSVFMTSFAIPVPWKEELLRKEKQIADKSKATLLLGREAGSKESQGCLLAFVEPIELMGIYCVGTDPRWRGRGIARAMLSYAENKGRMMGCRFMTLQTITSDGISPMYKKMGYVTEFERDILWHPLCG